MNILIADSGSTKTSWCFKKDSDLDAGKIITTSGINPFFLDADDIETLLVSELLPSLNGEMPDAIYFYGAGCTPEKSPTVKAALQKVLGMPATVNVESDMLGAARSLCGRRPGIACILGTGSNSCLYDGNNIIGHISPLGFILGDEGSGATLAKLMVGNILKGLMGKELKEEFLKQYSLTESEIIDRVYRKPFPNRFLASLQPFIEQHIGMPQMHNLVLEAFISFFERNVKQYEGAEQLLVNFTGSIAFVYSEILAEAAYKCGIHIGKITKAPLDNLVHYHMNK